MAVIVAPRMTNLINEFSDNLLAYESTFNNDLTWNITAGTGTVSNDDTRWFEGGKSLKIESLDNTLLSFNTASDLGCIAEQTGNYIMSFRIFYEIAIGDDPNLIVKVFKNGVLFHSLQAFHFDSNFQNRWNCHAQTLPFNAGDVISYNFSYQAGVGTSEIIWIDGFKLELDDRNIGVPTAWSIPKAYCCSDANYITDNSTAVLSEVDLNTAYPLAKNGFTVYAPDIVASAKIYHKTATGWISTSATIVT